MSTKKSKFSEEQIAFALRMAETGTRVAEICRKFGITEQTFYRWKRKYGGLGVSECFVSAKFGQMGAFLKLQIICDNLKLGEMHDNREKVQNFA